MSEKAELLPCPHCGTVDGLSPSYRIVDRTTRPITLAEKPYAIDCLGCGFDFTPRDGMDVVAMWNRRQDERDGGWQDIATCSHRDDDGEIFAWDGHRFDVVYFGWMEGDRPVWFNGDVPFDAVMWRPLPSPPHSKDSEG